MASRMERPLDHLDRLILRELQSDARLSFNELARRVKLSSPAVAERVRRMEESGVIAGYHARIEPAKVGLPITALVQLRCDHGRCLLDGFCSSDYPEILEIHKLGGERCVALKVAARSVTHLDEVLDRLSKHGEMWTSLILTSTVTQQAHELADLP